VFEKITDRAELRNIIWEDHLLYDPVAEEVTGQGRWHVGVDTVFKRLTDGKLFITHWRRGATENQDHEYPDEAVEAEEYTVTITKYRAKNAG
jgi:hypothetical protein